MYSNNADWWYIGTQTKEKPSKISNIVILLSSHQNTFTTCKYIFFLLIFMIFYLIWVNCIDLYWLLWCDFTLNNKNIERWKNTLTKLLTIRHTSKWFILAQISKTRVHQTQVCCTNTTHLGGQNTAVIRIAIWAMDDASNWTSPVITEKGVYTVL